MEGLPSFKSSTGEIWTVRGNAKLNLQNEPFLLLPGIAGSFIDTPGNSDNSIPGDIDIRVRTALTNWASPTVSVLLSKWDSGVIQERSFVFYVDPFTGKLGFGFSYDGTNGVILQVSTIGIVATNNYVLSLRTTMQVNDGAGNNVMKFYTSLDGINWVQLGATLTAAGVYSIFKNIRGLQIGTEYSNLYPYNGKIFSAELRNGIDGPIVAKFDPNDAISQEKFYKGRTNDFAVSEMTSNLVLRENQDGTIDARITGKNPTFGSCRINGQLITVTSYNFVRIWN